MVKKYLGIVMSAASPFFTPSAVPTEMHRGNEQFEIQLSVNECQRIIPHLVHHWDCFVTSVEVPRHDKMGVIAMSAAKKQSQ
ncbi:MAG: hypothetical protein K0B06_07710 [Brevefilum sp.]|nr:hypothetical protein [Brevefilum sp.]